MTTETLQNACLHPLACWKGKKVSSKATFFVFSPFVWFHLFFFSLPSLLQPSLSCILNEIALLPSILPFFLDIVEQPVGDGSNLYKLIKYKLGRTSITMRQNDDKKIRVDKLSLLGSKSKEADRYGVHIWLKRTA